MKPSLSLVLLAVLALAAAGLARQDGRKGNQRKARVSVDAPAPGELEPTLDERDRIADLAAEEELHRLRLGRLRRLHLLAVEAERADAVGRVVELGRLERERHLEVLGRLRVALREPLFEDALRRLAPGRERTGGEELPSLLEPIALDAAGVPVGVAVRPLAPAQLERRAAREAAERERVRREAEMARRRAEAEQRRFEIEQERAGRPTLRRSGGKGRRQGEEPAVEPGETPPVDSPPVEPPAGGDPAREGGRRRGGGRRGGGGGF